ncbi:MAG: hypothetical protein JXQ89_19510 [Pelagimonas sp.]
MRKALFVDDMSWDIPHTREAEWDQYDTAATIYVISHIEGRAVAASRMIPTIHESGGWSYMIRDASLGRLPGIEKNICANAPQCENIWEATRFTVCPSLSEPQARNSALSHNAQALAQCASDMGATSLIAMMKPAFIRWLRGIDLPTKRFGPNIVTPENERVCAIQMDLAALRDAPAKAPSPAQAA